MSQMTQEIFVKVLRRVVHDFAIDGTVKSLVKPEGRKTPAVLSRISQWYNGLDEKDRKAVQDTVRQAVHATLFEMLCVLDGVVAIESTPDKGELHLLFFRGSTSIRLNDPRQEMLHDIYQGLVYKEVFE